MGSATSWADGRVPDRAAAGAQFAANDPAGASDEIPLDVMDLWTDVRPLLEIEPGLHAQAVAVLAETSIGPSAIELLHGSHRGATFVVLRRGSWASGLPIRSDGGVPMAALRSAVAKAASDLDLAAG
ncbi:MAG: hypothetical protein ACT4QF_18685 [Sporichthyaceae bacterium]